MRCLNVMFMLLLMCVSAYAGERCNLDSEVPRSIRVQGLVVVIFRDAQCFGFYRDGALAQLTGGRSLWGYASTGRRGHETPLTNPAKGPGRVWYADRYMYSKKYDARMPDALFFMKDADPDVAAHYGIVTRPFASHGCVRLPKLAARWLFKQQIGRAHV